jgi:AraC-like DNA-binding protein
MQRLSTQDVPTRQRLAFVHDFIARNWAGMHFDPLEPDLQFDISVFGLPDGVALARARYPAMVARRPRELLRDGRDNYTLGIVSEDHDVSVEGGPAFTVRAGDLMLLHEATWFEMRHARASAVDVISLASRQIAQRLPRLALAPCYHIPRATQGADLLAGYADLLRQAPPQGEASRGMAARHIHDLVAVVLEDFAGRWVQQPASGLRAARLELARQDIRKHACDATLDVHAVARRQGVGARYIQELFEREGTTFTQFLRETRLELAWRRLGDAADTRSIATLAFECGFADLSHFNRSFRSRYGMKPSDVRAQALVRRRGN